jgi:O-antigen/teichoic acid export membrane protein
LKKLRGLVLANNSTQTVAPSVTDSPILAKNTAWNLMGYGTPAIAALFAIPIIIDALGADRFGILTLVWVLIGYLSLLDLGLGRALTKLVAEKLGEGSIEEIPSMIWTALSVMVLLSLVVSLLLVVLCGWIVNDVLKIPMELKHEGRTTFLLLSVFVPIVIISVGFRGILEAYQRFDMVNAVRIPLGILSFLAPLAVIPFTIKLPAVIVVLFMVRMLAVAAQFFFCTRIVTGMLSGFAIRPKIFSKLLRFGSWMTITNVISPLLVYVDRFFIGALLSVTAVAFYATPSEAVTQLALISAALMSVLFPAFSASFNVDRRRSAFLLDHSLKYVFMVMFPLVFIIVGFAFEGMRIWLNEEFAQNSFRVCQMLAVGVFFTCLGQMPYALIQGAGRPDLTGKLHLCQLPVYILILTGAIKMAGINGAAFVWAMRAMVDAVCMYLIAQKLLGSNKLKSLPKATCVVSATVLMATFAMSTSLNLRIVGSSIVLFSFAWIAKRYFLSAEELSFLRMAIKKENKQ